jgi:arginyl-tRNA synthetase
MRIESFLDGAASQAIKSALGVDAPAIVRPTQDAKHGDYQINGVLPLAKELKKNPRELATKVVEALGANEAIASAEVAGPGFVNLRLADPWVAEQLGEMLRDRVRDGIDRVQKSEKILVDFSSPNIAKQMHVGHIRSTIIGDAITRMFRFVGHEVLADNHLGDWGTQFGLLIVGMREWGSQEALTRDPILELERVYKLAKKKSEEDEGFAEQARAELAKLQAADPDNRRMWQGFIEATKRSLVAIYDRLGVRFDHWLGESAYDEMLPGVVDVLLERKLAREDQGALCIFFGELEAAPEKLKKQEVPFIVRKKDGAYLYSTTDIATILYRQKNFGTERAIYVVDKRQGQHFEQLFAVAGLLGIDMRLEHVGFGMVLGPDGTPLKTRAGENVLLASLLDEAEERAAKMMREELELPAELAAELAPAVGIGAVKYADLSQNRTSDYKFEWSKMITLKGNASPYLQYAHARCCSILRKGEVEDPSTLDRVAIQLGAPEEAVLARRLLRLSDVVHQAAENCYPHYLADHLYALASEYSKFHEGCPVLKAESSELRASRLALVDMTRRQLARGLELLGIEAPQRM